MNKNFKDISKKIESSISEFETLKYDVELMAANQAEVELALRTFATGNTGVSDVNGTKMEPYSVQYAKKRLKTDLQIANKDLIFKKQGSLIFTNMKIGTKNGSPAYGFTDEKAADIAGYQEEQNGTKIFQLNTEERANVNRAANEFLFNRYKEIISKWR